MGPGGLTVTNDLLNYTFTGSGAITGAVTLIKAGSGSLTLTESGGDSFSLGMTISAGTVVLDNANSAISGGASVSTGATLQIGNNDTKGNLPSGTVGVDGSLIFNRTDNLLVSAGILGNGSLTQNGSGTLTLSGNNIYSGNTTVNNGTLALTNSGTISNSAVVAVSSAKLDLSGLTAPTLMQTLNLGNSTITVAMPNQQTPLNTSGGLTMSGAGNVINVSALPPIASYPTTVTLLHAAGGISGYNMTRGTLPAGYSGNTSESSDNSSVLLTLTSGPIGVRPSVLWVGTNSISTTTNWSDRLNWQLPGAPTVSDNVGFGGNGAVGASPFNSVGAGLEGVSNPQNVNNFVDTSSSIASLTYTNLGATYHNTLLANGASLTVNSNGSLNVGSGSIDFGASVTEFVTIAGSNSTLNVNNTNGTMYVGIGNSGGQATLDLSGLGTFNASVSRFFVGVGSGSEGVQVARASGIVYLALTNTIAATIVPGSTESSDTAANALSISVGDDDGNAGSSCFLYLGQTNAIFADAIGIGRQKPTGTMQFNPDLINNNTKPSAYFRGANASSVATFSIGDQVVNSGSGESATGTCDFSGGSVNALVNNMYVGRVANNNSGSGTSHGTLTFENGLFSVTTLYDGYQPTTSVKNASGTINVKTNSTLGTSGTLTVSGNLNLGLTVGGTGAATTSGTLNIDGGTVSAGSIVCSPTGAGTSSITLGASSLGGVLAVANSIGTSAAPLTTLTLTSGTLQLNVNGAAGVPNVVPSALTVSGTITINIGAISHATTGITYPLISYSGSSDPVANLVLGTLPAGAAGSLVDDTANSRIGITFTQVPKSPGTLTKISVSGTTLNLMATNGTINGQFILLGTTSLASPVWKPVYTNNFDANGNLNLSINVINPAVPQEFYRLSQ
jgi:autotransporter-associated beta strand protein